MEDNIKIDITQMCRQGVEWIQLAQRRAQIINLTTDALRPVYSCRFEIV
jgi:hypothetical protein